MKINRKSWHYRLMDFLGFPFSRYDSDQARFFGYVLDSCTYIRSLSTRLIFLFVLGSLVLFLVSDTLGWTLAVLFNWALVPPDPPAFATIFLSMIGFFVFVLHRIINGPLFRKVLKLLNSHLPKAGKYVSRQWKDLKTGFVAQAYDRLVNKFCTIVEFVEEEEDKK